MLRPMCNPWAKKNPFLSLWLSSANQVAGRARGAATAAARRQAAGGQTMAVRSLLDLWTAGMPKTGARRRKRR